ncbi:hypothetical protein GCM10022224_092720 [Nonomuraea antimicrobica]|uniref:WXG100 family type VII secretion target n=1 Tax=Nonomuraea antimicrobica TaxID=561173 RepID=A0ABP7E5X9_9ACTN
MTYDSPEGLVDSPRHRALQQALANVRRQVAQLESALDQPFQQFTGAAVWVGPAARQFGEELSRQRQELRRRSRQVIDELEDELRRAPEKVSPAVAREESLRFR